MSSPIEVLTGDDLPLLPQTAGAISSDWAACPCGPPDPVRCGPAHRDQVT
jgi:hypothetical protein